MNKSLINMLVFHQRLSGSMMKVIAVVSMLIDHCGAYLLPDTSLTGHYMRIIGRIAFPVFALLVAEGYVYTRNVRRYVLSLLLFAVVSDIPWTFLHNDGSHNVLFTLAMGIGAISIIDTYRDNKYLTIFGVSIIAIIAYLLDVDYSYNGIFLIVVMYLFRDNNDLKALFGIPFILPYGELGAIFAFSTVVMYNGERGFITGKRSKYIFYSIYPIHLFLFYLYLYD